jgi:hypothetical protein
MTICISLWSIWLLPWTADRPRAKRIRHRSPRRGCSRRPQWRIRGCNVGALPQHAPPMLHPGMGIDPFANPPRPDHERSVESAPPQQQQRRQCGRKAARTPWAAGGNGCDNPRHGLRILDVSGACCRQCALRPDAVDPRERLHTTAHAERYGDQHESRTRLRHETPKRPRGAKKILQSNTQRMSSRHIKRPLRGDRLRSAR